MASAKIKIGPYLLGETLGTGSFGKVKRACEPPHLSLPGASLT